MSLTRAVLAGLLATAFSAQAAAISEQPYPGTIVLKVDATNNAQQIFRVTQNIPAQPGKLTLLYPQWVVANHGPSGALNQFAGFKVSTGGKALNWKRDPLNVWSFEIDVPNGASSVDVEFQYVSPVEASQGRTTFTNDILGVQWQSLALYPAGYRSRNITVQPNLTVPPGWQFGSALEVSERKGDAIAFKPLDLETLLDSPLFAGRYFRRIDLDPGAKLPVHLNLVADSPEQLEATPEQIAPHRALIQQAYKLFNSKHYKHYDFLLAISDEFGGIGREHHQSSENGVKLGYFTEWNKYEARRELLPHEFTHSWNGKFRRPDGQDVPNFNTPLDNSLLWVYEGQTQYWGAVLGARSGLLKPENTMDLLAASAARLDNVKGREWRAVQDTTYDPIVNARRPQVWNNWQRGEDYYQEGQLIWLDADTRIREMSGGKRSLNDFARAFFGVDDGMYVAKHYTFDEVVKALNAVQPYDWATFLRSRVESHGPGAPLDGLTRAGWKLVYTEKQTDFLKAQEDLSKSANFQYSLGFSVSSEGKLESFIWEGVGFKAGLSGNTTLLAVNGRAYKPEILRTAIIAAKTAKEPINLLVKKGNLYQTVALDYHDGLKYPRLERIPGTPDRLTEILKPLK
ncbi:MULTISPECIES: M61 family metallopeptidase [unclassified Duganella]|uniref:M61 family metallopeptidase n=1 Tax=unclassified Duganella TaxID=2636909 RepID=UPI00088E51AF|nr:MULTISPECIES: M61 family metallopeptidase [unclassified Duganella]SDG04976.1 Predicted metalloprotease, contains C-terminal PDZ domain [Duganella sp. OV458]SDJ00490.1 glycyl aminopeptidase. Metallo peptidase. MEROPS family M61 [Duganella sp. OV510]